MKVSLTPRFDFLADKRKLIAHQELVVSPVFKEAAMAALLEYQFTLKAALLADGALIALKLKGAEDFLNIFLNLAEESIERDRPEEDALHPV